MGNPAMKRIYDIVPLQSTGCDGLGSYFETPGGPRGLEAPMGQFYRGLGEVGVGLGSLFGLAVIGFAVYGASIALGKATK
jgi:hypothetical protein